MRVTMRMRGGELHLVTTQLQNGVWRKLAVCISRAEIRLPRQWQRVRARGRRCQSPRLLRKRRCGSVVRVSGADTGAVVPVRTAVTTATSLSEADIATIVDRVTRNLQPSIRGGAPVCPTSSEGEGEPAVPLLWCVWGAAGQSGLCGSQICTLRYSVGGRCT